ncbi:hypothetical protein NUW54_g10551 [Trametes sanguinea]|uniref:Uncharacterized protein n=1 Tax=Trametes sanguinea TaxID=158606 RepID=A0ACC1NY17_9APHY|nr:hypothetical protein NUW54_g10551 [Trametes sanguinea]
MTRIVDESGHDGRGGCRGGHVYVPADVLFFSAFPGRVLDFLVQPIASGELTHSLSAPIQNVHANTAPSKPQAKTSVDLRGSDQRRRRHRDGGQEQEQRDSDHLCSSSTPTTRSAAKASICAPQHGSCDDATGREVTGDQLRARTWGLANAMHLRWGIGNNDVGTSIVMICICFDVGGPGAILEKSA